MRSDGRSSLARRGTVGEAAIFDDVAGAQGSLKSRRLCVERLD